MNIAFAQINTTVGDVAGNEAKIRAAYERALTQHADLLLVPELATTGYPPRDLLLRASLVRQNLAALDRLAAMTRHTALVLGHVGLHPHPPGRDLTNAVSLLHEGSIIATRTKSLLPTYDVFDEDRYFEPADSNTPVSFQGRRLGLTICEDLWNDEDFWHHRRYPRNPGAELAEAGAEILINISASPWHVGKNQLRRQMLRSLVVKTRLPLVYCNLVGGNDELLFDGDSLAFAADGRLIGSGQRFSEGYFCIDTESQRDVQESTPLVEEDLYQALVMGLRDYLHKCGFTSAVLGLSGGIDSALVACLAVAALGSEKVHGVSLPSQFSSSGSLADARALAQNLGIRYDVIPIQRAFETLKTELNPVFAERPEDTTEENIQARLRGVILMALSNKFGSMVLTTGNKSEMAVGYCTLYGDMCGGLAVINDVPKTMVYRLARWINREREIIPDSSLTKPPSAELRPNQTDQDSLPPYEVLDAILEACVVEGRSAAEIEQAGHQPGDIRRVLRLIETSEYKRRQAAPGLKVTTKAFGVGRRIPIAQRFREA